MNNQVRFEYKLHGAGKALGHFTMRDKSVSFELSNVSNPLSDLLNGLAGLILAPSHIWGEDNVAWVEWYGQTSSWRWMLSTIDGTHLSVMVSETADMFSDSEPHTVVEGGCLLDHFILTIVTELDRMIKHHGLLNYVQQWQKDEFPVTTFLFLKKHLADKGLWEQNPIHNDTLRMETDLLLS